MKITSVRIKLPDRTRNHGQLLAFVEVEFDNCLVIHDMRVIDGVRGEFVAMPDRKIKERCPECQYKNELLARFCNYCGGSLESIRKNVLEGEPCPDCNGEISLESNSNVCLSCKNRGTIRSQVHLDIIHPVSDEFRSYLQETIIREYQEAISRMRLREWNAVRDLVR